MFNVGGGPGIRVTQFGGPAPRRRPRNPGEAQEQPAPDLKHMLIQFLPIILFFLLPVLSSLWSSSTPSGPSFSLHTAQSPYTKQVKTQHHKIPFWVNPSEYGDLSRTQKLNLDKRVVQSTINELSFKCQQEKNEQDRLIDDAQGWFSIDYDQIAKAKKMKLASCDRIMDLKNQGI
jgi:DnaJ family protein B protein 12